MNLSGLCTWSAVLIIALVRNRVEAQDRPNHLVPIPPYLGDYHRQVYRHLLAEDARRGPWMVVFPSFQVEYAVQLLPLGSSDEGVGRAEIRVTRSNLELWAVYGPPPPPPPPGSKQGAKRPGPSRVKIRTFKEILPADVAEIVMKAWRHALLGTRIPEHSDLGCDGAFYHFYYPPHMYASTWSPEGGLPAEMVELGEALCRYTEAREPKKAAFLAEVQRCARSILAAKP